MSLLITILLTVQLVKVLFKLLMATHPAHSLILFLYHLTCVCLNLQKNFAKHIHDVHAKIRRKFSLNNEKYKLVVACIVYLRNLMFGAYVMVRIRLERIPKTFSKKLYAKAMGPYSIIHKMESNAYLLDLPNDMDISLLFNIEDLLPYQSTFEPSTLPSSVFAGEASKSAPIVPLLQYYKEMVDIIFDDEFVTSRYGGFHHFLVK